SPVTGSARRVVVAAVPPVGPGWPVPSGLGYSAPAGETLGLSRLVGSARVPAHRTKCTPPPEHLYASAPTFACWAPALLARCPVAPPGDGRRRAARRPPDATPAPRAPLSRCGGPLRDPGRRLDPRREDPRFHFSPHR